MHRRPSFAFVLALAALPIASAAPLPTSAVEGSLESVSTTIDVKLDDRLSSQDARAGDTFAFELTGSVMLDGVPAGAGTRGHGVVLAAQSGAGARNGSLSVAARTIDLADGRHIPVGIARGPSRTESTYVGSARDNNVVYEKGTRFTVVAPPPQTPSPDESP